MKYPLSCLVSVALVGGSLFAGSVLAGDPPPTLLKKDIIQKKFGVILECKNPGTHQDVAKTPQIKNTTNTVIPKGHKIHWGASDGDKGVITLDKGLGLAAGQTVQGLGKAWQVYTCTASTPSW